MKRFFVALFTVCLLTGVASAGRVRVSDNAVAISQSQVEVLTAIDRWPFDLHVFTGTFASRQALDSAVHECITAPNVVCIGIDPKHRFSYTHFGTATGVRPSDFNLIAAAGNTYFRTGDWAGGATSIADRAYESAKSASSTVVVAPGPTIMNQTTTTNVSGWWIFFGVLLGCGVLAAVIALVRKQKRLDKDMGSFREERNEYLDANVSRMTAPEPTPRSRRVPTTRPYVSPTPQPAPPQTVVVDRGGSGDMLTGMLIGQAISRPTVVEREVVVERHHAAPAPSRHDDDGGSSSSGWGSSSSSDSGGGGSSFDSGGGGFDSGGGGSDGGGGGGDF